MRPRTDALDLTCFLATSWRPLIRPAPMERDWMDKTPSRFAYRCLPLSIANAHGWEVLLEEEVSAYWDGGPEPGAVHLLGKGGGPPPGTAHAHFGSGIVTFSLTGMFRTPPRWDLFVTGPINRPKPGAYALTAVVETDDGGHTFTMNWTLTDKKRLVRWERHEPFCHLFPIPRDVLDSIVPSFRELSSDKEAETDFRAWSKDRDELNDQFRRGTADKDTWGKEYTRGVRPDGTPFRHGHRTKLRLPGFADGAPARIDAAEKGSL